MVKAEAIFTPQRACKTRELQVLLNILSKIIAHFAVVRVGLTMSGRRMDEYIEPSKFEMSLFV